MDTGEQEESSARRRERLLALRSAAASSSPSPSAGPPLPSAAAAWDLPEPDLMGASNPRPPPRFDFYTNPGAAFSSATAPHKRKSACSPPPSPAPAPAPPYGNYDNNYPPPHQHQMAPSPIHSPYLTAPSAPGSSPWRSPMQFQPPVPGYRGARPGAPPHWNPHSVSSAQDSYPHAPSFGFRGANVDQRGTGRGRGENYYNNPGSSGRGGRGGRFSFQNHSGQQDWRDYYRKSMVDDPWRDLQPIVGNIMIPCKCWIPASLRAKKETSAQGQMKPPSGLSLAEYLDLSFNEASNETVMFLLRHASPKEDTGPEQKADFVDQNESDMMFSRSHDLLVLRCKFSVTTAITIKKETEGMTNGERARQKEK